MLYVKSFLAGVAAAVASLFVTVPVTIWIADRLVRAKMPQGSGVGFVSVSVFPFLVVAVVAFVAGFSWTLRRARRHAR
jgi:multisubunit Na+/H+ antiporter MnhB subunit